MHRQVGDLEIGPDGLARRGLLIRHLVMPGLLDETREILGWIAAELGPQTYVNLMDQYHPANRACEFEGIAQPLSAGEYRQALEIAREFGLTRLDNRGRRR
jgi:putative pyruvate formate lyase activating enzyme